jgi:hypothetical protein
MGFPAPDDETRYGGKTHNALTREVEIPYPTIDAETRARVEEFIGCTLEQSYSEFTVELKNAVHRMLAAINHSDYSKPARHRGHARRRQQGTTRLR